MAADRKENREQLQTLLRDLFQFDASDLDFGIYRILNQRRDQIDQFIEEDLLDAVEKGLSNLADAKRGDIEEELEAQAEEVRENVSQDAINPDGSINEQYEGLNIQAIEEYRRKREELEQVEVSEETEARVLNDLYRFFSRYYEDGDFHTKRRISSQDSKYYVPYNGEEVYFHWANNDQYYVKTSEHFTDYRFDTGGYTVKFRLEEANVPQDNVKGDSRYFVLGRGDPVEYNEGAETLVIRFQYRQITEDEADAFVDMYNEATGEDRSSFTYMTSDMRCKALESRILDYLDNEQVRNALTRENDDSSTPLEKNLERYVSENTMDYFVHKDLSEFLHGELDFFLKNEVLGVDDLLQADDPETPAVLRARTVRTIADRIISFLTQIEDFQKRLFEKKKFIVQTDYMVTLDQVPDELYNDILENDAQLSQWEDVYNTEEWDTDLLWQGDFDETFLENHPYVMVDTALFDKEFKFQLLAAFDDLEDATDGVLLHGENFQALNLLTEKYRNEVDCTYIDPPYNTGGRDFLYKDNYQHSSWLSMMADRLEVAKSQLSDDGAIFINIDDNEQDNLRQLMNELYGRRNFIANIIWQKKYSPQNDATWFSDDHDHILLWALDKSTWRPNKLPRSEKQNSNYTNPDDDPRGPWMSSDYTSNKSKDERPNLYYPITNPNTGEEILPPEDRAWAYTEEEHQKHVEQNRIWWGKNGNNSMPRYKRFLDEVGGVVPRTIWPHEKAGHNQEAVRELKDLFDQVNFTSPKPSRLMKRILRVSPGDTVSDFFAGSGTTAHAVLDLNKNSDKQRKYLLTEMGDYFDSVLRPRIQKLAFSLEWEEGVPENREGQTHLVKYHRLESYEDALNNVTLEEPSSAQQKLVQEGLEDYVEGYMLDFEAQESASLLPDSTFDEPFNHELKIEQNGTSREPVAVDLVETFHYLIGADVRKYRHDEHQDREYVVTECDVQTDSGVEQVLTVWRQTEGLDLDDEAEWFDDKYDSESYDRVYVNRESYITQSEPLEITFREKMEEGPNVS